ncbi:MAG: sulfotransferase, partial [Chloroflexota bacterium]
MYDYITGQETYQFVVNTYQHRAFIALYTRLVLFLRRKKMILIFGMSRSGTSMLAEFLAMGRSSIYLHEPDSELMKKYYTKDHPFRQMLFWNFVNADEQKAFKVHLLNCILLRSALKSDRATRVICIKPIALLNVMPEIIQARNIKVLYISRHPAGRSESILRQLQHDVGVQSIPLEKVEELGRDWGKANRQAQEWFTSHPRWRWVIFENLANDPLGEFKKLYADLGLAWEDGIEQAIRQKTTGEDGDFYETKRDASKQADKW